MKLYSFEKLEAWKHSKTLAIWIYRVTNAFPRNEEFGLTSQMRRAAISISSNIAEGSSRMTAKDQMKFYTISFSSTIELLNHLIIANSLSLISDKNYVEGRDLIEKQTYLISKLRKACKAGST